MKESLMTPVTWSTAEIDASIERLHAAELRLEQLLDAERQALEDLLGALRAQIRTLEGPGA